MNNKPWAYVTSAWSADRSRAKRSAKRYCRKLYEAGYTPICPLLSLPEVIDTSNGYVRRYVKKIQNSCGLWFSGG